MSTQANGDRRVAVVTGGAGAIGGAIAARLAPDHTVVVLDRTGDVVVDLGDPADVRRAAGLVLERYGRCDVLVHAAAMVAFGSFEQFELDVWRQVQAVNVESALLLTQAFAPEMRNGGFGRVILIVSNSLWRPPGAHMLSYVAAKGALVGMARTLAVGLGGDGIADDLNGRTSSELVADLVAGARVVKAANTLGAEVLGAEPQEAGGRRVIFVSGDDADAKADVVALFEDAGFAAIDVGDLATGGAMQQIHHPLAGLNLIRL